MIPQLHGVMAVALAPATRASGAVRVFGVTLIGISGSTGVKLLFSLGLVALVLLRRGAPGGTPGPGRGSRGPAPFLGSAGHPGGSYGHSDPRAGVDLGHPAADISTGAGLLSAGLAFALQQVIASLAAYFVILRGDTFGAGDWITLGGVRGDVVRLGFLKTTVMEMGQPPAVAMPSPRSGSTRASTPAGWSPSPTA